MDVGTIQLLQSSHATCILRPSPLNIYWTSVVIYLFYSLISFISMKINFALLFFDDTVSTENFCVGVPLNIQSIYHIHEEIIDCMITIK